MTDRTITIDADLLDTLLEAAYDGLLMARSDPNRLFDDAASRQRRYQHELADLEAQRSREISERERYGFKRARTAKVERKIAELRAKMDREAQEEAERIDRVARYERAFEAVKDIPEQP